MSNTIFPADETQAYHNHPGYKIKERIKIMLFLIGFFIGILFMLLFLTITGNI
jgi:hypothetical protein